MIKKLLLFGFIIAILAGGGCIKETYDMKKLSKRAHLSPTYAVSAVKGEITLSDIVESGDTVVFGQDKFVKLVFRKDSVIDLRIADFIISKNQGEFNGEYYAMAAGQGTATFGPETIDLDIEEILSHISGTLTIPNPSINIYYTNSFADPIQLNLFVTGTRADKTVDLNPAPFTFLHPVLPTDPAVTGSFKIDKSNSSLPDLISLPPEKIYFSGTAVMNISGKGGQQDTYLTGETRLSGSVEVEIPLEFRMNNLQFSDTVDNFMIEEDPDNDNPIKPENFDLLRIDIKAVNGFPLGVSMSMSLYNPLTHTVIKTVTANDIIKPAQVDSNGKTAIPTESATSIEFTKEFFDEINNADQIIFTFKLNTTDNGTKDVKIYSDYMINFKAALVLKPDINIDLK